MTSLETQQPSRDAQAFNDDDLALVRLTSDLADATSILALERAFRARFGRLLPGSAMYGFYVLDEGAKTIVHNVGVNVSDLFVARYVQIKDVDPLVAQSHATGRAVYNRDLMGPEEWAETDAYRSAYVIHEMRHVVEVPVVDGSNVLGALHFGASDTTRNFTARDLRLAEAVARILASMVTRIRAAQDHASALERALAALDLAQTAIVTSAPLAPDLHLNAAARRLLAEIEQGEACLPPLLVSRVPGRAFSRRAEVHLRSGATAALDAHSQPASDGTLVTVLDLHSDHPLVDRARLAALTPRETDVALLMVDGLSDREIGERLVISRYTVQQYVKRIYRALNVDSRVSLTRLVLGAPVGVRRS